ncbi:MAG: SUMF1/EgtB/PvdO family nonheme iron enzyme [Polyangiaceae bacterium]
MALAARTWRAEAALVALAGFGCAPAPPRVGRRVAPPPSSVTAPPPAPSVEASVAPPASSAPQEPASAPCPLPEVPSDMLPVPGGSFAMGSDDEGEPDERPRHEVSVAAFLLDVTEVTQAAYAECVSAARCAAPDSLSSSALTNGHPEEFRRPDHPVVGVGWADALGYCEFRAKRLPSEAEWERAARGDDGRRYVWGDAPPDPKRHGVFGGRATTEAVGRYPAGQGPYGHLDLAGNVWEWVFDLYDPYAYRRAGAARGVPGDCDEIKTTLEYLRSHHLQGFTGKNPIPSECEHVLRGGAYNYGVGMLRASNRVHHPAGFRIAVAGFRCARDFAPNRADCVAK